MNENHIASAIEAGRQIGARAPQKADIKDAIPYIVRVEADGSEVVELLDGRFETPHRHYGTVKLSDAASFIEYWKQHHVMGSTIYASIDPACFVAVLNEHKDSVPGFRDFRAVYQLGFSRAWTEWRTRNKNDFDGNVTFAEWLEDQLPDIVKPEGAKLLEIAINMKVHSSASFGNAVRLSNGHTEFTYSNTVEGASKAGSGKVAIPETFTIEIPIFAGLNAKRYRMEARFRYRLRGSELKLRYELVRPGDVVEQAFADVLKEINDGCKTTVLFGSPE